MTEHQAKTQVPSAVANGKKGHTLISDAKFRQLYELTLLLRAASGHVATAASRLDAVMAGVMADLRSGDTLITDFASLSEGRVSEPLRSLLPTAMRSPAGKTMADLIIESLSNATVDRLRRNARVTVIFVPTTGADLVIEEAWSLAGAGRLPVIFVEDGRRKTASRSGSDADATPSIPVDSADVIAIYRVAHESIARARHGSGPTRIVCTRWKSAGSSRSDAGQRLEQWLTTRGLPVQEWRKTITAEIDATGESRSAANQLDPGDADSSVNPQPFAQANIE